MKRLLTVVGLVLGLALCGLAGPVSAQDQDQKVASQVETLLGGFEYVPTKEDWERIGPEAATVLRQIAADPKAKQIQRARAISSLANFPQSTTQVLLKTLIAEEAQPLVLRRKAMRSLANGFGVEAIATIEPFLASEVTQLRETAIVALGSIKSDKSRSLLKAQLKIESSALLKETIQKTLVEMNK